MNAYYKCGDCFYWRELSEQPTGVPSGQLLGKCCGLPPQMFLVPVQMNQTQSGIVVAKDREQPPMTGAAVSQNQPMMLNTADGCSLHMTRLV